MIRGKRVIRNIEIGNEQQSIFMVYLITGHLIYHEWMGLNVILHIYPNMKIPPPINFLQDNIDYWRNEFYAMQLYYDIKEKRKIELKEFLKEKEACFSILKDCIILLQQLKPSNIFEFIIEYFQNLPDYLKMSADNSECSCSTSSSSDMSSESYNSQSNENIIY